MLPTYDTSRAIIEISGEDRVSFLQGIVTQDVNLLAPDTLLFAAILTPQGKLAHDFFMLPQGGTILLDTPHTLKDALIKRLTMYKLRAKVTLRDASREWQVSYAGTGGYADPRHPEMPHRIYSPPTTHHPLLTTEEYHSRRIALGVPESPYDTNENDVAMDLGYDLLNAISFTKGCYVGQEVTARMHYKQIARKGFFTAMSANALPASGAGITADGIPIGTLRGSHGGRGLALIKFEEYEVAIGRNTPFLVDKQPLELAAPSWLAPKLAQFHASREKQ